MPGDNFVFSVQCGFSFTVMMFCIGMLARREDPTYYLPILTSIIGYWLPAPRAAPPTGGSRGLPNLLMRRQTGRPAAGDVERGLREVYGRRAQQPETPAEEEPAPDSSPRVSPQNSLSVHTIP